MKLRDDGAVRKRKYSSSIPWVFIIQAHHTRATAAYHEKGCKQA
jgi:hypothetical protein